MSAESNKRKKIILLKQKRFREIQIQSQVNDRRFSMFLLTKGSANQATILDLLGKWRKANEHLFSAQFTITRSRTKKWLINRVVNDDDRVLFIIQVDGKYIGHVGLFHFDFTNNSSEIDNVIRGENDLPGVMSEAIKSLMAWATAELGIHTFNLKVRKENLHAIKFYKKIGYSQSGLIPLVYNEQHELEELPMNDPRKGDKYYIVMTLLK